MIAQRLCFNCLRVGHSSKNCKSTKACRICNLHHHTSLCNQQTANDGSKSNDPSSSPKGQTSHARSSSGSHPPSHPYPPQQQQQQKPTTTQGKSNTTPITQGSSSQSVTNINLAQTSSLTSNVLPTAMLDLRYFNQKLNTRAFFDTGSQCSFISPEIGHRLNTPFSNEFLFKLLLLVMTVLHVFFIS